MQERDVVTHEEAAELLPWLVNGTLLPDVAKGVEAHAAACTLCYRELAMARAFAQQVVASGAAPAPPPDMRNINARIDAYESRRRWIKVRLGRVRDFLVDPWRALAVVQAILLGAVAIAIWSPPPAPEPAYRTLSAPLDPHPGDIVRATFAPELGVEQIEVLLGRLRLQVVAGPSAHGVYTLAGVGDDWDASAAAEHLQQDPRVVFAEPVERRRR